jgi:PAS domain S-box-containing protein
VVDRTSRGDLDSARALVRSREAKRAMDAIDKIVSTMEEQEKQTLADRQAEAQSDFDRSLFFLLLGSALNIILIVIMFVIMSRQLKARTAAAEELRQGEERLQTVLDSIQEGITYSTPQGGFEVFNHGMTEITGYTIEDANRAGDFSRLLYPDPEDHQRALDGVDLIIKEPGPRVSETTITSKSGARKILHVSSQMLRRKGRRMFLTTYTDITCQKALEERLRNSEEKLRLIFDHALDGMSIFEESGPQGDRRLVECNERYALLAGRSRGELLQRGSTEGIARSLSAEQGITGLDGKGYRGSFTWIRPDGKENIIEYTTVPIEMHGKHYTIGIDRDVTETRKADEIIRDSQRRYRQLFEASPVPLMIYDAESLAILEVNPAAINHYGYSREDFLAMTVIAIRPEEDVPRFLEHIRADPDGPERRGSGATARRTGRSSMLRSDPI